MKALKERLVDRRIISRSDLVACYRAHDVRLDRPVFLKVLNPALGADPEVRARFEREARAVAKLDHPNLIRIHEFGEDPEEGLYLVQEWVEGETLRSLIDKGEASSTTMIKSAAYQILIGLAALHEAGIVHRDLKPENILVRGDGRFKISDLSLAAVHGAAHLTHHQAVVGTPAYMSPEQAAGEGIGPPSDLFALGTVLIEMAIGRNPYVSDELLATLRKVREADVLDDQTLQRLPESIHELVQRIQEKSPADRFPSAGDALRLLGHDSGSGKRLFPGPRPRVPILVSAVAALLLVIVFTIMRTQDGEQRVSSETRTDSVQIAQTDTIPTTLPPIYLDSMIVQSETAETQADPTPRSLERVESAAELESPIIQPESELESAIEPAQMSDSVDLLIHSEPWAHVFLNGYRLGTTPFAQPVRLPTGPQTLSFRNAAYPRVDLAFEIADTLKTITVGLDQHVTTLDVTVEPWGELFVDEEYLGATPLSRPLRLLPGVHQFRITHPGLPALSRSLETQAGEHLQVTVDLNRSELAVLNVVTEEVH